MSGGGKLSLKSQEGFINPVISKVLNSIRKVNKMKDLLLLRQL